MSREDVHWLAVLVLCYAPATLFCAEAVALLINISSLPVELRVKWLSYNPYLLAIPGSILGAWSSRSGWAGIGPLFVGCTTVYFLAVQFRGAWIWDGTFDNYSLSPAVWIGSLLTSAGVSFLLARATLRTLPSAKPNRMLAFGYVSLLTSGALSWVLAGFYPVESSFAATRVVGHLSIALLVGVSSLLIKKEST